MEIDFKQIDQTGWLSFDLGEGSYYYGQVSYLDSQGNPTQQVNDKPIKHGLGIYIYKSQGDQLTRYEGHWANDLKNGSGKMTHEDGSVYSGNWRNGSKNDQGVMRWTNGDIYEGGWKRDLMDGLGKFTHHEGRVSKGTFKCNYFIEGEVLKNPFLNDEEAKEFADKRKNLLKIKEKVSKQQLCFFERVKLNEYEFLRSLIEKSNSNNRVPLIFPSTDVESNIVLFDKYSETTQQAYQVFDLRKAFVTPKQQKQAFLEDVGSKLNKVLTNGQLFIIDLDDSDVTYLEKYYPNIKEYYSSKSFPSEIWSKSQILKPQVHSKLHPSIANISPNFNIAVWTKHRIQQGIDNKQVIQKIQKRFDSVLPMLKIDYIFINK